MPRPSCLHQTEDDVNMNLVGMQLSSHLVVELVEV